MTLTKATRNVATSPPRQRRSGARRGNATGWMFVGPFAIVFLAFLILPLAFALYLSLFQKSMIGGTRFVLFDNYLKAFTDPSFLDGVWFVISFSLVLIPLQMAISLAIALILDLVTTSFARFSRLMIFLPYAIPAVIGALMWGFLYSKNFGPIADFFQAFGATGPDFLSKGLIFWGLLNIVTWQWAGYYMRSRVRRTSTGTATTPRSGRSSGRTRTSRIAWCTSGRRSPSTTATTTGSRGTTR